MAPLPKTLLVGLMTGVLGAALCLMPAGQYLEERIGLPTLFQLRGPRTPPSDVAVIALDKESSDRLDLPEDPSRWPRSLHTALLNELQEAGPAVVAFDVVFHEPRSEELDAPLEEAIRKAGNIILCEFVKQDMVPVNDSADQIAVRRVVGPLPRFAKPALALAPFPLPKVPVSVNQYWIVKPEIGASPTLPAVTFQAYGLSAYGSFWDLLNRIIPSEAVRFPQNREQVIAERAVASVIRDARSLFSREPGLAESMLQMLGAQEKASAISSGKARVVRSLISLYRGSPSRYLNFYGPPGSFPTIPIHRIIQPEDRSVLESLKGKALFVGVAHHRTADQQDDFFTVFSKDSGIDLTGVEIAATAFSNLLEDCPVLPMNPIVSVLLVSTWGIVVGGICYRLRTRWALVALSVLSAVYLLTAVSGFKDFAGWPPLVVTLGVQSPFAFWNGLFWRHRDATRERRNIQEAFGYFLPKRIVDQLAEDVANLRNSPQIVSGTCLCTDGAQYATLAERFSPGELTRFLNDYYQAIFPLVQRHGGRVSDIIGDSMLAVWTRSIPPEALNEQACLASIGIARAVDLFNAVHAPMRLPTRIGLSFGEMSFGHIGGAEHYEYRPVGDTVNTASRIEELNKALGTQILAAGEVVSRLKSLKTRELGTFLLAGKSRPVSIHEILCPAEESRALLDDLCDAFARGLSAYRNREWEEARHWFQRVIEIRGDDGPSGFYLSLSAHHAVSEPDDSWDGSIAIGKGGLKDPDRWHGVTVRTT